MDLHRVMCKFSKKVKVILFCMYGTTMLNTYTVNCMKNLEVAITNV